MYLSFYNLRIEPFAISADPKFLWLGKKHREALAILQYGVRANKAFLLLTGDVGTGKTTLINALLDSVGKDVLVGTIHDPGLEPLDFLNCVARAFNINKTFTSKGTFLLYLEHFLKIAYEKEKKVLLIIDEAQRLSSNLLEEIRQLSNIERADTKLITIFLVGQNELNEILLKNENRALKQQIGLFHKLEVLNESETEAYIRYRLQVAGSERNIFNRGAIKGIYSFSGGYPRLINIVCDHALLTGYVREKKTLGRKIVQECAGELRVSLKSHDRENSLRKADAGKLRKAGHVLNANSAWRRLAYGFLLLVILFAAGGLLEFGPAGAATFMKKYWGQVLSAFSTTGAVSNYNGNQGVEDRPEARADTAASDYKFKQKEKGLLKQPDDATVTSEIPASSAQPDRNPKGLPETTSQRDYKKLSDYQMHDGYTERPYDKGRDYEHYDHEGRRYDYHGHWRSWDEWDRYARRNPLTYKHGKYYHEEAHLMFRFCEPGTGNCMFFSIGK